MFFRYENTAFVNDEESSVLSDYPVDQERAASVSSIPVQQILKPKLPKAKLAREQVLTTISEREDAMLQREALQKTYAAVRPVPHVLHSPIGYTQPYTHQAPPSSYAPSLYGSIPDNDNRSQAELIEDIPVAVQPPPSSYAPSLKGSIPDNDIWSHSELESEVAVMPYVRQPKRETATVTDYFLSTQRTTETEDDISRLKKTTTLAHVKPVEELAVVPRKPKIAIHNIEDVYLTTTTEIQATETTTKTTKDTIAQHVKAPPPPPPPPLPSSEPPSNWDVTIRQYQTETDDRQQMMERRWDAYSEVSEKFRDGAESTTTEIPARRHLPPAESATSSPYNSLHRSTKTIPHPTYTSVIFKILEPPSVEGVEHLTPEVKERWQTCITTDETFRYLVQEATTVEEYIRITKDSRYEKLFDTRTWHVIIRALSTPDDRYPPLRNPPRYRKRVESDPPRNRRSSLPPVTELSLPPHCSSRRTSRSGSVPEYDLRSMTEVDVDFAHADRESLSSVDTGYTYRTARSLAERSTSEFLEDVPTMEPPHYLNPQQQQQSHFYAEQSSSSYHMQDDNYPSRFQSGASSSVVTERRRMDCVVQELRQKERFSRLDQGGDTPRAIVDREEIKSVTETDVVDWKR